jgi:hypothetical protein
MGTMRINSVERLPVARIQIGSETPLTKKILFKVLDAMVVYHEKRSSYESVSRNTYDGEVKEMAFWCSPGRGDIGGGVCLYEPAIHVNCCDFVLGRRNFSDLIQFVVVHEKTEIWNMAGRNMWAVAGTPESDDYDDLSHDSALLAEYRTAILCGKGGRHLGFMVEFGEKVVSRINRDNFIVENLWAYDKASKQLAKRRNLESIG